MGKHFAHAIKDHALRESKSFQTSQRVTLLNGDSCAVSQWVLVGTRDGGPPQVACIQEIVQIQQPQVALNSRPAAILLQSGVIANIPNRYRMPCVSASDQWVLHPVEVMHPCSSNQTIAPDILQQIICAANLQHDCHTYRCKSTTVGYLQQERHATQIPQLSITHNNAASLVINIACMHDVFHTRQLRIPLHSSADLLNLAIHASVAVEIDRRKTDSAESVRGGGSRQGRGTSRGRGKTAERGRGIISVGEGGSLHGAIAL
jgi:hypothetical protein